MQPIFCITQVKLIQLTGYKKPNMAMVGRIFIKVYEHKDEWFFLYKIRNKTSNDNEMSQNMKEN